MAVMTLPGISSSSQTKESPSGFRRCRSEPLLRCSVQAPRAFATLKSTRSVPRFLFNLPKPVRSILFETEEGVDLNELGSGEEAGRKKEKANWTEKLLELRRRWRGDEEREGEMDCYCSVSYDSEEEMEEVEQRGEIVWDQDSFARLLARVPWTEAKLFCQLAYLCNMAYVIPEIKENDLKKYYGLRFVTSSLEKKSGLPVIKSKARLDSIKVDALNYSSCFDGNDDGPQPRRPVRSSIVYHIAALASSYVHSRAQGLLSKRNQSPDQVEPSGIAGPTSNRLYNAEVAAYMAASTVTAVVAAQENARKEAAEDLSSVKSSPCEWFVCDDRGTRTRNFIIQGSDSLESWQANLFFEPTEFEDTGVLVHRGIYEAAKGMYQQLMPEISSHIQQYGERARLRFSGHSLGGSLALLVSLMLLTRGAVELSMILPVVTFGAPSVFCGGQKILEILGLEEEFVRAVMMHRDIVPRAFSCSYPNQVAMVLKRLNGVFRTHHCLNNERLLYAPLGKIYIIQPDVRLSPPHPLLPEGAAFYMLEKEYMPSKLAFASALHAFMNSPHPLETLSDLKAYGSDGTILRDHESSNYFRAIDGVLSLHTRTVVSPKEKERLTNWWPLIAGNRKGNGILHRCDSGKELVGEL